MRFKLIFHILFFFIAAEIVFPGEYTSQRRVQIRNAMGESDTGNPVEAFNSAIEYATQSAQAQGEAYLRSYSESRDSVLDSIWIKKESHLQVVDLHVKRYQFLDYNLMAKKYPEISPKYRNYLFTQMDIDFKLEYLDVPRFIEDYQKTIQGATYRSMAIPGWGQVYNRQYTTGFLYATAFWTFYTLFAIRSADAGTNQDALNSAFVNLQIPAMIFWAFNVSDAATSRYLGKIGLRNLAQAYRLKNLNRKPESKVERGFKIDFIFFQAPLYKLWSDK
ncbi:MAG: hypothetical protein D6767_07955 [Candidatus Hydrogenedentota bacterium]|nr:MAG: hypothetical protein D6767_07955 [Candidatus Hydrogenedentota bacterium]